ncbi:MAG: hypothetical protein NTX96_01915 [Candidatus Zambryskibacteria bacterium]|nr:hypothetical protein [Candidatus Zambryskibacteria bacterium]
MVDSIERKNPNDELDSALNPEPKKPFDVLDAQKLHPEPEPPSGIHDFAEISLQRPTDLPPIPEISNPSPVLVTPEEIENNQESYKVNPHLIAYILSLIREGNKKLGSLQFDLNYLQSEEQLRQILNSSLHLGHINEQEYEKMLSYLDEPKPTTEKVEENEVVPDEPKLNEGITIKEDFVVPPELILYIKSLMKQDIGPKLISEALEEGNLSKKEVLTILSDGFHHLKILSEEEYKKALSILGESQEDITKHIGNIPVVEQPSEAKTQDSDVGAIEEALKKEEAPIKPVLEPVAEPIIEPVATAVIPEVITGNKAETDTYETLEQIDTKLAQTRSEYATQYITWKNQVREKKGKFKKMMSDLGMEKQMPESERPPELMEAEKAYIEAKKKKANIILGPLPRRNNEETGERDYYFNADLFNQAEREYNALQEQILDSIPPLEKSRVLKAMEKWAKYPLPARIALTTTLMTGAGMLFGTVAIGGAAATLAYRGARSFVGATFGQEVGALVGQGMERRSDKRIDKSIDKYAEEMKIDLNNFEEKEKELMRFREKEENQIKKNRLKKVATMIAVGAGVNLGADMLTRGLMGNIPGTISRPRASNLDNTQGISRPKGVAPKSFDSVKPKTPVIPQAKINVTDNIDRPPLPSDSKLSLAKPLSSIESTTQPPITNILETKVELSSQGFLQDIHNLKAEIIRQYGNNIPPEIKTNIIDRPSVDIAKEYGLYKPGNVGGDSAMGYTGEKLSIDTNGHLVIEHIDGTKNFLSDANTGGVKTFEETGGKMFTPKPVVETSSPTNTQDAFLNKNIGKNIDFNTTDGVKIRGVGADVWNKPLFKGGSVTEQTPNIESNNIVSVENAPPPTVEFSPTHIPYKDSFVDVVNEGNEKVVKLGEQIIAHEHTFSTGKILILDDKFQDGPQNSSIREAFVTAFEKNTLADQIGQTPTAVPFEGGRIYIIQGLENDPNGVKVLLNGKEIARGLVEGKGVKIQYNPTLPKTGWIFLDNVYERAFNQAKKIIKTLGVVKK